VAKNGKWVAAGAAVCAALLVLYVANASSLASPLANGPRLLAHRGVHQTFSGKDLTNETCTATRIYPPHHRFLENTIPAIKAAFSLGASVVEIDVHPTTDGQFAVFHDWTLDCRTDGHGITREHSLAELKRLDVGYGYTADGGKTFPFRGQGIGMMPSLDEVLDAFPHRSFLINVKSNDPNEGVLLAKALAKRGSEQISQIMVYGGDRPIASLKKRMPQLRVMSRASIKSCFLKYIAFGWTGYVPEPCRNSILLVPSNVGSWLWGWPNRFDVRMATANTVTFVSGRYTGGPFSTGIDSMEDFRNLPKGWSGGISTDRIEILAKILKR
jgi:glycerophosphoryl diester phosphodiesterase